MGCDAADYVFPCHLALDLPDERDREYDLEADRLPAGGRPRNAAFGGRTGPVDRGHRRGGPAQRNAGGSGAEGVSPVNQTSAGLYGAATRWPVWNSTRPRKKCWR